VPQIAKTSYHALKPNSRGAWQRLMAALDAVRLELICVQDMQLPQEAHLAIDALIPHHPEHLSTWRRAVCKFAQIDLALRDILLEPSLPQRAQARLRKLLQEIIQPVIQSVGDEG
jgi:hypothetical protein